MPGALELPRDREHHADHVLHVDRAAAPDVAVLDGAGERVHAPVGGLGGHHVEVAVDQQRAAVRVGAGQPGEDVAAARCAGLDVLGLVADLLELLGDPVGALRLALGGLELTGVGGVEPDQRADEVDHLVGCARGRSVTVTIPTTCDQLRWFGSGAGHPLALAAQLQLGRSEWRNGRRASLRC